MSSKQVKTSKPGRPKTGRNTVNISATISKQLAMAAREQVKLTGESFSGFLARCIHAAILQGK